ncbi:dynein axonemal assembly factor 8 [Patella vulgata]|uniref:dynein axonemal assembly factor 8 n=1 Tax=Patella vulgata TaxID=6465 RepID=UPI00217F4853|nr:dynein axonemal assembly factor 8 [Patella vulgata]
MELLGLKWLPYLTTSQAKEVTPIEVGDKLWKDSIHRLTSEPAFVLALRGVGAFIQLESMVPPGVLNQPNKTPLHKLMSHTAEEAYTFARLFFSKHELYIDNLSRPLLPYIPESLHFSSIKKSSADHKPEPRISVNIFDIMKSGSCPIKTFLLIKPGAVKKHPLTKFLKKFGQEGFRVVGLKLDVLDEQKANVIIQSLEIEDEGVQEKHLSHLTSGPSVLICLERENSVKKLVDVIGPDDPQAARRKSQFLWRGIFGSDPVANGLYGSVNYCTAVKELEVFFPEQSTQLLDNSQQEEVIEDSIIDVDYNNNRQISINHDGCSLHYEDSTMAGIHATLLLQTNCILLTPPLLGLTPRSKGHGYVEVMESLQTNGFEIVGARMVNLSQTQAEQFLCLTEAGSFKQVPVLLMGPCIVLAIQRDNAVVAFNSIFESTVSGDTLLKKYGQFILRSSTVKQAHKLLPFFFDSLMPGSQITITTNKSIQA